MEQGQLIILTNFVIARLLSVDESTQRAFIETQDGAELTVPLGRIMSVAEVEIPVTKPELLTVEQAANTLGTRRRWVRRLLREHKLDGFKVEGRWFVNSSSVLQRARHV